MSLKKYKLKKQFSLELGQMSLASAAPDFPVRPLSKAAVAIMSKNFQRDFVHAVGSELCAAVVMFSVKLLGIR